tara:strand:+ start:968 stop:1294 length:327 start_codon:yes stop_codon:yes gene_type:complete
MIDDRLNEDGTRKDATLTKDYEKMGHSVGVIKTIIEETKTDPVKDSDGNIIEEPRLVLMNGATDEEKKFRVSSNVAHLETMKAKTDWKGNEDWTDVDKAITDGKAYVG